jgi:hypothetical protein
MLIFRLENPQVAVNGYRLVQSVGELRFVDDSNPVRILTYGKIPQERIAYRFETGTKVTESGIPDRRARPRLLSE